MNTDSSTTDPANGTDGQHPEMGDEDALDKRVRALRDDMQVLNLHKNAAVVDALSDKIESSLKEKLGVSGDHVRPEESQAVWGEDVNLDENVDDATRMENKLNAVREALNSTFTGTRYISVLDMDQDNVSMLYDKMRPILVDDRANKNLRFDFVTMQDAIQGKLQSTLFDTPMELDEPKRSLLVLGRKGTLSSTRENILKGIEKNQPEIRIQYAQQGDSDALEEALNAVRDAGNPEAQEKASQALRAVTQDVIRHLGADPHTIILADQEFATMEPLNTTGANIIDAVDAYADAVTDKMIENIDADTVPTDPGEREVHQKPATEVELAEEQADAAEERVLDDTSLWRKIKRNTGEFFTPSNWIKGEKWKEGAGMFFNANGRIGQWTMTGLATLGTLGFMKFSLGSKIAAMLGFSSGTTGGVLSSIATALPFVKPAVEAMTGTAAASTLGYVGILIGSFAISAVATYLNAHRDINTKTEKIPEAILNYSPPLIMGTAIGSLILAGAPIPYIVGAVITQAMLGSYYRLSAMSRVAQDIITTSWSRITDKMPGLALLIAKLKTPRAGKDVQNPEQADKLQRQLLTGETWEEIVNTQVETHVTTMREKSHTVTSGSQERAFQEKNAKIQSAAAAEAMYSDVLLSKESGDKSTRPRRRRRGMKR